MQNRWHDSWLAFFAASHEMPNNNIIGRQVPAQGQMWRLPVGTGTSAPRELCQREHQAPTQCAPDNTNTINPLLA